MIMLWEDCTVIWSSAVAEACTCIIEGAQRSYSEGFVKK